MLKGAGRFCSNSHRRRAGTPGFDYELVTVEASGAEAAADWDSLRRSPRWRASSSTSWRRWWRK